MRVVGYDPDWRRRFEEERLALERVLAPWLEGGIHHVGSTAVPGLAAKPVIDMVAGVHELEAARGAFEPMLSLGYTHRDHRPEAHLFVKGEASGVHLTEPGSDLWHERLAFRDALRADPALRAEYAAWKAEHAVDEPGRFYDADKRPLVLRVLAEHGIEPPDAERLSASALAAKAEALVRGAGV